MFCQNCGCQMRDDDRFCPNCGALNGLNAGGAYPQGDAPAWGAPAGGAYPQGETPAWGAPAGGAYPQGETPAWEAPAGGAYPQGETPAWGAPAGGAYPQGDAPAWGAPAGGAYPQGGTPSKGGKKKKTGLIIGIAAAVAVVAVAVTTLVAVAAGGLFASPKGQVEKAFLKSVDAYHAAWDKFGVPDVGQWQKNRSIHQQYSLELRDFNSALANYDLSALKNLGLRVGSDYNGEGRKMSMEVEAYWGQDSLVSFQAVADDNTLSVASPEFTGGDFYGVNTNTLGDDLADLTGDDSVRDLSFNLFDLVDLMLDWADTEKMKQGVKDATLKLWEAAEVEKTGEKTMDINGASTKTTAYHITIPEKALDRYMDDLEDVMSLLDYADLYESMFRSIGMPEDVLEEFLDELDDMDVYSELFDGLREAIDDDLELDVCLSGGRLSAILYETRIDGTKLELTVCLGGKKEYVDDITVTLASSEASIEIQSSGDHGMKGGAYTDETTLRVRQDGSTLVRVTSEMRFDPKGKSDNFQWKLSADGSGQKVALDTEGGLELDKDHLSLDLNTVSIRAMDMKLCTLAFQYAVNPNPNPISAGNTRIITSMSELELMGVGYDIERNAERWASDMEELFTSRLPSDLLWYMMRAF